MLTDEQRMVRRSVRGFVEDEIEPDYPIERYYRDARTMTIPDGTTEIQKLIVGYELTDEAAYL